MLIWPESMKWWHLYLILVVPCLHAEELAVVAFAKDTLANDWRSAQVQDVVRVLSKYESIDFIVKNAQGSTALQIQQIEDLILQKTDVLIVGPRDQNALTPVIEKAYHQGIPVILLSRSINSQSYTSFVHPENYPIGQAVGNYLIKVLQGEGHVLILEGIPNASTTKLRTQGYFDAVKTHSGIKTSRLTGNYLKSDAIHALERALERGLKFDAIYAHSDDMATAALMVLQRLNIELIPVIGIDYTQESKQNIISGKQWASFTYPTGGREGAQLVVDILEGKPVPKELILESIPVTLDTVFDVEPIY